MDTNLLLYLVFSLCLVAGIVSGLYLSVKITAKHKKKRKPKKIINLTMDINNSDEQDVLEELEFEEYDTDFEDPTSQQNPSVRLHQRIVNKTDSWSDIKADVMEVSPESHLLSARRKEDHSYNSIVYSRIQGKSSNLSIQSSDTSTESDEIDVDLPDISEIPSSFDIQDNENTEQTQNVKNQSELVKQQSATHNDNVSEQADIIEGVSENNATHVSNDSSNSTEENELVFQHQDSDFIIPDENEILGQEESIEEALQKFAPAPEQPKSFSVPKPKGRPPKAKKTGINDVPVKKTEALPVMLEPKLEDLEDDIGDDIALMGSIIQDGSPNIQKKKKSSKSKKDSSQNSDAETKQTVSENKQNIPVILTDTEDTSTNNIDQTESSLSQEPSALSGQLDLIKQSSEQDTTQKTDSDIKFDTQSQKPEKTLTTKPQKSTERRKKTKTKKHTDSIETHHQSSTMPTPTQEKKQSGNSIQTKVKSTEPPQKTTQSQTHAQDNAPQVITYTRAGRKRH